jgi:voltage-gated potassium channel
MVDVALREGLSARWGAIVRYPRTPVRAARAIAVLTLLITVAAGLVMHLVDRREFPTLGLGLWWAAQTVTTVGYGDAVPEATGGRIVALFVMLNAIGFLTVVTGAITAALIDTRTQRYVVEDEVELEELCRRLERVLQERQPR